jgi:hypothetical protein
MTIEIDALTDALVSHALTLGEFDRVNAHEPKAAPGNGITMAVWVDRIEPVRSSGLNSTTVRLTFNARLYTSMLTDPQDAIDPALVTALSGFLTLVSSDFTLDGLVRSVDLLGAYGTPLSAEAGYVEQDKRLYRVFTVVVPLIINDSFDQAP